MTLPVVSRGDWLYGAIEGYSHWREVLYSSESGKQFWCDADLSSLKVCFKKGNQYRWVNATPSQIPHFEGEEEVGRVARFFWRKPPLFVVNNSSFFLSTLSILALPFYYFKRAKIICDRSGEYGFAMSVKKLAKMTLLMIALFFALVKTIVESLFVIHPANGDKLIAEIEMELNERANIDEAYWSTMGARPKYDPRKGWFYLLGCMQSPGIVHLSRNNEIISASTYDDLNKQFSIVDSAIFDPHGSLLFKHEAAVNICLSSNCPS